ncbi:MAG: tRNA (cytidine(34)-2'-O)-methyltransferase [Elusimicrobiota bacterium]
MLRVALIEPEIPGNTGNIGRTCLAAGAELHLVGRLGFELSERRLRRAGLDYWDKVSVHRHGTIADFLRQIDDAQVLAFSAEGAREHWDAPYAADSWLVFGSESRGLPEPLRERWRERTYRVPMNPGARSLNLSSAAAVVLYEACRSLRRGR